MGKIKQTFTAKRKAKNKNAKYKYSIKKIASTSASNRNTDKKYSYTKKITGANGKVRYYYA